ncbi:MAG: hypothetical protein JNL87_12915 [Burkholderiaceae bacterium]|nr:hypothetical protein [Burkholderiaceae bacterium]
MPRSVRQTVILAKVETTYATDAAPTNTTDAVLVRDFDISIEQQFAARPVIRSTYGADDQLPTVRRGKIKLVVDLQNSGTAGTVAPQWGDLLIGCATAETLSLTTPNRAEYDPISTSRKSLTIWAYKDGLLYKFVGCMGDATFNIAAGEVPTIEFMFTGLVSVAPAAGANPVPTLTGWIRPVAASPANSSKVTLGCTYSAGAAVGGTAYDLKSLSLGLGNDVQDVALMTTETVDIYNRASKASLVLDLTAANEATQIANMYAGTTVCMFFVHGTTAGYRVGLFAPNGVITGMSTQRDGSNFLVGMELTLAPSGSGNNDFKVFLL